VTRRACPADLKTATLAIDDPQPYVPESFDDHVLGYDLIHLTDTGYAYSPRGRQPDSRP
jgi:hypothetical protein